MNRVFLFACLFALVLSIAGPALAQSTADLHVSVKDPNGAVVANATVTIRDEARNFERSVANRADGEYQFLLIPPGTYNVVVEAPGFGRTTAKNVVITIGQAAELPVMLKVAGAQEELTVSAETETVETQRSSVATTITQQRIDNLPINGRNYINFTLTNSQTARDTAPSIGAAPTSGLNIGGQRARANLVNVDGVDAVDNSVNGIRSTVSQDAVQEFQIQTNGYSAEYGRASGGVINIVTRSGTNALHGSAFGFLRHRSIQAPNPFSTVADPAYTRVETGFTLGGPIKKDKTFFFFSYETRRRQETGFSTIGANDYGLAPVDVSPLFGAPAGTFVMQGTAGTGGQVAFFNTMLPLLPGLPAPAIAALQQYAFLMGGSSGIAIDGSYPAAFALITPPVPNQLQQFPTTCNPTNLLCNGLPASFMSLDSQAGNYPVSEGTSVIGLRLDHRLTNNNNLLLRANVSPSTVTGIQVQGQSQNFGQNGYSRTAFQQFRDLTITAQDTATIGDNKINEFRFQYARRGLLFNFNNAIPEGSNSAVNIVGTAFIGREPFSFVRRTEQRFQFADNFTWNKGKHTFKFGADINRLPLVADFTVNFGNVFNFGALGPSSLGFPATLAGVPIPGFSAVQAYGLGIPSTMVQGLGDPHADFANNIFGFFVQDSWRLASNLTLNIGVRYDLEILPEPEQLSPIGQDGYAFLGIRNAIPRDSNNVAPRIGIAWDPFKDGKTVVRASYGLFYDHPLLGLQFLAQATDASGTPQLLMFGGSPCSTVAPPPGSLPPLNATNVFQGILQLPTCLGPVATAPTGLGYLPAEQRFDPSADSLFIDQGFLSAGFPLNVLPFGFPNTQNFQFAYSNQANLTLERDLGGNFNLSVAYNFNGGRHLNRPINANTVRTDLLIGNWERAVAAGAVTPTTSPLAVAACGVGPAGPYMPAALVNFFRPSGLNPALAGLPPLAACVAGVAAPFLDATFSGLSGGVPTVAPNGVPFSDMAANYANGSSVYHGMTVNLRKRMSHKYEFLASYTWSHAIDDSTDLQSPLSPQDSYLPDAERSNSTFDQRHRFVLSGVYQTGRLGGDGFFSKFFSDWTVSPLVEISSGRPFSILTATPINFQFAPNSARPNAVPTGTPTNACGFPTVESSYSPTGAFQIPCYIDGTFDGVFTGNADGNLGRNTATRPYTIFTDLRVARRIRITERVGLDAMVDMFNVINKFNVADVNFLYTEAGRPTAAFDPRQFQFGLRLTW